MIKEELKKFPPGDIGGKFETKMIKSEGRLRSVRYIFYFEENELILFRIFKKKLKSRGLTIKEWYDYHYLPRDENGEYIYPKCKYCGMESIWSIDKEGYLCYCNKCKSSYRSEVMSNTSRKCHEMYGSDHCSKSSFISRYGEKDGILKWNEWRKKISDPRSLKGLIEKLGETEGTRRYEELRSLGSYSHSLNGYIDKYGLEDGVKYHESKRLHRSKLMTDPNYCISIYGDDKKYQRLYNSYIKNISGVKSYSNISKSLFDSILDRIRFLFDDVSEDIYYGDKEWKIPNTWKVGDSKRFRIPDFFIKSKRIILEFNGVYWHKRPNKLDFMLSEIDQAMEDIIKSDLDKLQSYRRLGFYVFYIHETEYLKNPDIIVEDCIKFITNNSYRSEYTKIIDSILNIGVK